MNKASRFVMVFWAWYMVAAAVCLAVPQGRVFIGALGMSVFWGLLVKFQGKLREWIDRIPVPEWVCFFGIGLVSTDLVMENLAINFRGDLHPNLGLNCVLWLGSYLGCLIGWWIISRRYWFEPRQVFFVAGLMGILVEHNWMIPKLLASGQWFSVVVSAPILAVVYGGAIAPAFLLVRRPVSLHPLRKPGVVGFLAALFLPLGSFYAGGTLWLAGMLPLIAKLRR